MRAYKISTAARMADASHSTIKRWLLAGHIKGNKLPTGHWRVDADSLNAFLDGQYNPTSIAKRAVARAMSNEPKRKYTKRKK